MNSTEPEKTSQYSVELIKPVELFLQQLREQKNYSLLTQKNYQRQLMKLLVFIQSLSIEKWSQLKTIHIRQLAAQSHRRGLSPKSIALLLSACRSFFSYLIKTNQLEFNPAKGVRAPKAAKLLPKVVEVDQISALLDGIDVSTEIGIRDKAIAELFYSSGIRLAELINLKLIDLDLVQGDARITGKGEKTRIVPIGEYALIAIKNWLSVRKDWLSGTDISTLFITQRRTQMSARTVQKRMEYWGKFVGLNSRLHPHKFRHSCATHLLESSSNLRAVQELLGHANISTTQVYTHLDFQQLAVVYDASHPRAKKQN